MKTAFQNILCSSQAGFSFYFPPKKGFSYVVLSFLELALWTRLAQIPLPFLPNAEMKGMHRCPAQSIYNTHLVIYPPKVVGAALQYHFITKEASRLCQLLLTVSSTLSWMFQIEDPVLQSELASNCCPHLCAEVTDTDNHAWLLLSIAGHVE